MSNVVKLNFGFSEKVQNIKKINFPENKMHLWRLSSSGNHLNDDTQHHYVLRDGETDISLFDLKICYLEQHLPSLDSEGAIFLYFMFSDVYSKPPKKGTPKKSVRLNLHRLSVLANSNDDFLNCLEYINISLKQNHANASHWKMKFNPIDRCNDFDTQLILQRSSEHTPVFDEQNETFIQKILDYIHQNLICSSS